MFFFCCAFFYLLTMTLLCWNRPMTPIFLRLFKEGFSFGIQFASEIPSSSGMLELVTADPGAMGLCRVGRYSAPRRIQGDRVINNHIAFYIQIVISLCPSIHSSNIFWYDSLIRGYLCGLVVLFLCCFKTKFWIDLIWDPFLHTTYNMTNNAVNIRWYFHHAEFGVA